MLFFPDTHTIIETIQRETRFPYLDEDVVAYLELLPTECKCDFSLPLGSGDKRILRLVARMIGVTVRGTKDGRCSSREGF